MSNWDSPLPRDVLIQHATVPTSTTARTTVTTDVSRIAVTNTTAATIVYSFTDGDGNVIANIDEINIDPGSPVDLEFRAPIRCNNGIKDFAGGAGLIVDIWGRRVTGWTQTGGYCFNTST